jgi:heme/copper-type cytochrome/quinol oxidase subunit 3
MTVKRAAAVTILTLLLGIYGICCSIYEYDKPAIYNFILKNLFVNLVVRK